MSFIPQGDPTSPTCRWCKTPKTRHGPASILICSDCDYLDPTQPDTPTDG